MVKAFENMEVWFVTGAQLLYGGDAVLQVDNHSKKMVEGLNESGRLPIKVIYKGTANSSKEVADIFAQANNEKKCVGVITWMHTFSPAKMWIHGLQILHKPLLHLHTQFNEEIPWNDIDMDFMTETVSSVTLFHECASAENLWSDIGKKQKHKNTSQYGSVSVQPGLIHRICSFFVSEIK